MATRHKIWSFTPTHSPVLGRRTDPNTHHVLNATNLVMIQFEREEERGDEEEAGEGGGGEIRGEEGGRAEQQVSGKEPQQQVRMCFLLICLSVVNLSICLFGNVF